VANHASAKKRHRQNLKRRARNAARQSRVRKSIRLLRQLVAEKQSTAVKQQLPLTISEIMRARSKGVLHWRTARRRVARLSRLANTVLANKS